MARWGANEERNDAIFSFDQVAVMLSWKLLRGKGSANCALSPWGGEEGGSMGSRHHPHDTAPSHSFTRGRSYTRRPYPPHLGRLGSRARVVREKALPVQDESRRDI